MNSIFICDTWSFKYSYWQAWERGYLLSVSAVHDDGRGGDSHVVGCHRSRPRITFVVDNRPRDCLVTRFFYHKQMHRPNNNILTGFVFYKLLLFFQNILNSNKFIRILTRVKIQKRFKNLLRRAPYVLKVPVPIYSKRWFYLVRRLYQQKCVSHKSSLFYYIEHRIRTWYKSRILVFFSRLKSIIFLEE